MDGRSTVELEAFEAAAGLEAGAGGQAGGGGAAAAEAMDVSSGDEAGSDAGSEGGSGAGASGDDAGSASDDDSDDAYDDGGVWELSCDKCSGPVTRRGTRVRLIADGVTSMFSTDLISNHMEDRGRLRSHEACACEIRDIFCAHCRASLGYHVLEPCRDCLEGGNNGHFYMFLPGNVVGSRRAGVSTGSGPPSGPPECDWATEWVTWDEIGAFEPRPSHRRTDRAVFLSPPEEVSDCTCAVCFEIMEDPVALPCGHTFCRVCASRAVDLQRCCPLDRLPAKHTEVGRAPAALRDAIERLQVCCVYATRPAAGRDGGWERIDPAVTGAACCSASLPWGLSARRKSTSNLA